MTWIATVAPVLKQQIELNALEAAVVPAFEAEWADDKQPYVHPEVQAELLLQVTTVRPIAQEPTLQNIELTLTGLTLVFAEVGLTGDTVTRSAGSWIAAGVRPGMYLSTSGTVSNNFQKALITQVSDLVLTLDTQDLIDEAPVGPLTVFAEGLSRTVGGHRILNLQVKCQSDNHLPQYWAVNYLERLTQRLEKQSVYDALGLVNCGIIDTSDITYVPNVKVDKRILNVATFDIQVSAAFDDTDGEEIVGFFDHIDLTGALVDPGGVLYPTGVNPNDVIIPPGV